MYLVLKDSRIAAQINTEQELIKWLKGWLPEYLDLMRVYHLPDNGQWMNPVTGKWNVIPTELDIAELLK